MSEITTLEAQIAARQQRLSGTVDELAARMTPQALLEQNTHRLQSRISGWTTTPAGELRVDRVAAAAAVVAALVALRVWGGRRRRARRG